jgi:hypothetical protein
VSAFESTFQKYYKLKIVRGGFEIATIFDHVGVETLKVLCPILINLIVELLSTPW